MLVKKEQIEEIEVVVVTLRRRHVRRNHLYKLQQG
jgi:hypothetical protein